MERNEPRPVKDILQDLFREQHLEDDLLMRRAMAAWPEVVGPVLNRMTVERRVASGTLYVRMTSAVARAELSMQRTLLLEALNKAVGKIVLTDIKFL